jgi:pimeloyl-ACP methyl ester carboxylesterase
MQPARDGSLQHDGVRLHWLEWGPAAAPLVVLLHGSSAHAHWWDFFAPALAERHRVVAPDLRGHGDSGHADPAEYSLEHYAADVEAIVAHLGARSLRLVGHSLGALVAVVFAARNPGAVERLVLVDIRLRSGPSRHRFLDRLRHWPHPLYANEEEAARRFRLLPSGTSAPPEILAHVARMGVRRRDDGQLTLKFDRGTLSDAIPRDVRAELAAIRCPLLYVRGERSALVPPKAYEEVRALAPQAELAVVAGAYHHVMLDDPAGFAAAVLPFLA